MNTDDPNKPTVRHEGAITIVTFPPNPEPEAPDLEDLHPNADSLVVAHLQRLLKAAKEGKVQLALLALLVQQVRKELLAQLDQLVHKEQQVLKEEQDHKEQQVLKEEQDHKVLLDQLAQLVLKELKELPEEQDHKVLLDLLEDSIKD